MPFKLNMTLRKEIARDLRLGKTQAGIAARFGVSRQRVHQIACQVLPAVKRKWFKCKRCGHAWRSRGRGLQRPNSCPRCGTQHYTEPKPMPRNSQSIYQRWINMLGRCRNPNLSTYKYCGGRGIRVCARWQSFENFVTDVGKIPKGKILIRLDNAGHFEPRNCKWGTRKGQSHIRRQGRSSRKLHARRESR